MASFSDKLTQTIVYWSLNKPSGTGGYIYNSPVELAGRWEDRNQKFVDVTGEENVARSVIYLDQDVEINGWLYLGSLSDLSSGEEADPGEIAGTSGIIQQVNRIPSVDGSEIIYEIMLRR